MAVLSDKEIAAVAYAAGFKDIASLSTAVAVALAESGGNARSHNGNAGTGDNSYGLWQINMLGKMGPARRKQFGISSNEQLYLPATNAKAAYMLYKQSGGWGPWSAYKNGSYKQYQNRGATAAMAVAKGGSTISGVADPSKNADITVGIGDVGVGLNNPMSGIQETIATGINSVMQGFFKIGFGVAGVGMALVLIAVAVTVLMRKPLGNAAKKVIAVAPTGKAAKVAGVVGKAVG